MASTEPTENGSIKSPETNIQNYAATTTAPVTAAPAAAEETESTAVKSEVEEVHAETETETETEAAEKENDAQSADAAAEVAAGVVNTEAAGTAANETKVKWPGWPGNCVFRLVVPVLKVGSIIGRKGDLIKKMCEETRARIRVLDGPISSPDRIVLITGKEEPDAPLSPAMDAAIRVFKRVTGLPEGEDDSKGSGAATGAHCSIRLLVASTQAINLIGKQGSLIKSIQESTGASVRVLSNDEMPIYANSDERIVELQGEALKVLKALEAVVGHLRKFLVDHSVLPLFERGYNTPVTQERPLESWSDKTLLHTTQKSGLATEYPLPMKRDSLFLDRESHLEPQPYSGISMYGQDPGLSGFRSSGIGRAGGPIVTQVSQTMQIPLTYAEDIIGAGGTNIAYIRRTSGAILTVQESGGLRDEITVEIKGTSSQVQTAQQLIQEFISGHKDSFQSSYSKLESGGRPSYSQLGGSSYSSSSFAGQSYGGGYGSSGVGGYSSFRL